MSFSKRIARKLKSRQGARYDGSEYNGELCGKVLTEDSDEFALVIEVEEPKEEPVKPILPKPYDWSIDYTKEAHPRYLPYLIGSIRKKFGGSKSLIIDKLKGINRKRNAKEVRAYAAKLIERNKGTVYRKMGKLKRPNEIGPIEDLDATRKNPIMTYSARLGYVKIWKEDGELVSVDLDGNKVNITFE